MDLGVRGAGSGYQRCMGLILRIAAVIVFILAIFHVWIGVAPMIALGLALWCLSTLVDGYWPNGPGPRVNT